jgi:hypothetical protein
VVLHEKPKRAAWLEELLSDPRVFAARVRAEMHLLVRALSRKEWEDAAELVHPGSGEAAPEGGAGADPEDAVRWEAERFEASLAPFFAEHAELLAGPEARRHEWTLLRPSGPRRWEVTQTLLDPEGDNDWALFAEIDLRDESAPDGPILRLRAIGS